MLKEEVILFSGQNNPALLNWLRNKGENVIHTADEITIDFIKQNKIIFLISYNYQYIFKQEILNKFLNKAINLHISYLPWNRGADPNFWSFMKDTPKGVTIHYLDEGIDTGDIICQKKVIFDPEKETLASSYQYLQTEIQELFKQYWEKIKLGRCPRIKQSGRGSFHKRKDKVRFAHLLTKGWDTPVLSLQTQASKIQMSTCSKK